ncbi:MAG: aldose 1-epimerase family protein [Lacisediminihabitans sp.]
MRAPTGEQFELARSQGNQQSRAIITEVAAGLRALSINGVDLVESFPATERPPFGSGIVLVPWPNRIEDGVWLLDGREQQLDLTEPARRNAIHGLLRNAPYRVIGRTAEAVTLAATVFPQHGYPFQLDTTVRYELVDDGLAVTHGIRNVGDRKAPVAIGTHPFFRIGGVPTEELTLTVAAGTRFELDARLNPLRERAVDGTDYDLRSGRRVSDLQLDDAFGAVTPVDGISRHILTAPDGRFVELWQEAAFGFVQVFTTREFPTAVGPGLAVAIEPMTVPPNAFNTGQGLRWLEPDERWSVSWGVRYGGPGEQG